VKLGTVIVALVSVLSLALASCGSSDDETPVSMAQFHAQGNAICWKAIKTQQATYERLVNEAIAEESVNGEVDIPKREELVDAFGESLRTMGDELSDLGAPAGKDEQVEELIQLYEGAAEQAEDHPNLLVSGGILGQPDAAAKAIGLSKCASM
jgi:hypothetical protein